jgi:hypothetical protein
VEISPTPQRQAPCSWATPEQVHTGDCVTRNYIVQ